MAATALSCRKHVRVITYYCIAGKFGEYYIWQIGEKTHLASFNLAILARDPLTQYTKCLSASFILAFCPKIQNLAKVFRYTV